MICLLEPYCMHVNRLNHDLICCGGKEGVQLFTRSRNSSSVDICSSAFLVRVCSSVLQTLILFQTNIYNFLVPISDLVFRIHRPASVKSLPVFQTFISKWLKSIVYYKPKMLRHDILYIFGTAHTYMAYMGEYISSPPPYPRGGGGNSIAFSHEKQEPCELPDVISSLWLQF